jgi:hypothetical protein
LARNVRKQTKMFKSGLKWSLNGQEWPKKYIMVRNAPYMNQMTQNSPLAQLGPRPQVQSPQIGLKRFKMDQKGLKQTKMTQEGLK